MASRNIDKWRHGHKTACASGIYEQSFTHDSLGADWCQAFTIDSAEKALIVSGCN